MHTAFGIGTNLTNDIGFEPLSIVIKMTRCNGSRWRRSATSRRKRWTTIPRTSRILREVFQVPEPTASAPSV
jgi:nicotinate phosphoribosyltransferase